MPSLDPADYGWDRELEKGPDGRRLPDCRVKPINREGHKITIGRVKWDAVYCASCHKLTGACPPDSPFIFYICDPCVREKGAPPDCIEVR